LKKFLRVMVARVLGFGLDGDAFLGFGGLVEAVGPLAADHFGR